MSENYRPYDQNDMQKPPMNKVILPKFHCNANEMPTFFFHFFSYEGIVCKGKKGYKYPIEWKRKKKKRICKSIMENVFIVDEWNHYEISAHWKYNQEQEVHRNERKLNTERKWARLFNGNTRFNKETRSNKSHINIFQKMKEFFFPSLNPSSFDVLMNVIVFCSLLYQKKYCSLAHFATMQFFFFLDCKFPAVAKTYANFFFHLFQ